MNVASRVAPQALIEPLPYSQAQVTTQTTGKKQHIQICQTAVWNTTMKSGSIAQGPIYSNNIEIRHSSSREYVTYFLCISYAYDL